MRGVGAQDCQIIRLLPVEDGAHLYCIKCGVENVERVAKEEELALRSSSEAGS
jgi:hypothetical protein